MSEATLARPATRVAVTDPIWFLGLATRVHAGPENTDGTLSVVEQVIPAGFASPWHVHHDEDESFLVLEGEMEITVSDEKLILGEGAFGRGPRGVPHGFRITGNKPARVVMMTSGPRFAEFVRDVGQPWSDTPPPPPGPEAMPMLLALAEKHGLTIFGPMAE